MYKIMIMFGVVMLAVAPMLAVIIIASGFRGAISENNLNEKFNDERVYKRFGGR